ncbi:hypothetical protein PanWU01x14_301250, partial [Parasponia andersonii]
MDCLNAYCYWSGQKVNAEKFNVYFSKNLQGEKARELIHLLGIKPLQGPGKQRFQCSGGSCSKQGKMPLPCRLSCACQIGGYSYSFLYVIIGVKVSTFKNERNRVRETRSFSEVSSKCL